MQFTNKVCITFTINQCLQIILHTIFGCNLQTKFVVLFQSIFVWKKDILQLIFECNLQTKFVLLFPFNSCLEIYSSQTLFVFNLQQSLYYFSNQLLLAKRHFAHSICMHFSNHSPISFFYNCQNLCHLTILSLSTTCLSCKLCKN